jgi:hypothetical protein
VSPRSSEWKEFARQHYRQASDLITVLSFPEIGKYTKPNGIITHKEDAKCTSVTEPEVEDALKRSRELLQCRALSAKFTYSFTEG